MLNTVAPVVILMNESKPTFERVADEVTGWIEQTETLLAQTQAALESLRFHTGVAPDAQRTLYQLLVVVRQRRAQLPTPQAVQVWVRARAEQSGLGLKGPARFLTAPTQDDGSPPPPPAAPPTGA
jgi:hypothetical protein